MAHKIITGSDLYKGFKLDKNTLLTSNVNDLTPFQMLSLEDKTADWIKAVADYYEVVGWNNVEKKATKIQRNYWMRHGVLNPNDYIVNPTYNDYYQAVGWVMPPESQSPLQQFYPLAPNFVDLLRGELLKRDNTWTIEAIDEESKAEAFRFKDEQFKAIMAEYAMLEKKKALAEMGLSDESDPESYEQEMAKFQQRLQDVELASKSFRTTGQIWAQKVIDIHQKRYNLEELEPDAFECGLITDSEYWHLDLMDDDFRLELINPKWVDNHKGPNIKYVSDGDYFLWFDFMSSGDIINKLGRRMKIQDMEMLKEIHIQTQNILVPDQLKSRHDSYYNMSDPWRKATDLNPALNDALLGNELAYSFMRSPNFDHNIDVDILNPIGGRLINGQPQMFRVMRLYWRSFRKIGWLTKINRDGTRLPPEWVDENYKVTIEPVYDKSVVKEETKDNLLYGEHIEWEWVPEWRHLIKISPNQKHTFWLNNARSMESIIIDGAPVKFQFKGRENPFNSLPPVEGCKFSYINVGSHSFIDRIKPLQILYNICMNKVPKKFLKDYGNKVAIDKRIISTNNLSQETDKVDPIEEYENNLQESDILTYSINRESLEGMGQPGLPQILQLSTVDEAQAYFALGQMIKAEAGELIGITRQRLGQSKASDSATAVNQGIVYSESQTEKYYEQHSNVMKRVRQRMLDATQYYSTFKESSREMYLDTNEENVWLEMEGMKNLTPHYNLNLTSTASIRSKLNIINTFLREENTLDIQASKKVSALVEQNLPKLKQLIREGELESMQREREQRDFEAQQMQQAQEAAQRLKETEQAFQRERDDKMIQKDIQVATIRALGGIQTDVDADQNLDASENLDMFFKQQQINDARQATKDTIAAKRQTDIDKMLVDREKSKDDILKEQIKGEYGLKIAKENKTAAELKRKQAAKKKKK